MNTHFKYTVWNLIENKIRLLPDIASLLSKLLKICWDGKDNCDLRWLFLKLSDECPAKWRVSMWIFNNKGTENTQHGKDSFFSRWCWENWLSTCRRRNWTHLTAYIKINSKETKDLQVLNVRPETIKLQAKNMGGNVDIGFDIYFLDFIPKAQATKAKVDKWDCIKLKCFWAAKETDNRVKK